MAITAEQRNRRQRYLGSSDVAAILGADPWRSPQEVALEKMGRLDPSPFEARGRAVMLGNRLEPVILDLLEDEGGMVLDRDAEHLEFTREDLRLMSHPDALVVVGGAPGLTPGTPVEVKTSGLDGPLPRHWTPDRGAGVVVPDVFLIQAHVHMICAERATCLVAALLGGHEMLIETVERSEALTDAILEEVERFWIQIRTGIMPPETPPLDVARRIRRVPGTPPATIPLEMFVEYRAACDRARQAVAEEEEQKARILSALGEAEAGVCEDESDGVTFFEEARSHVDLARLRQQAPELVQQCTERKTSRVLRYRKNMQKILNP